jgi:integrase
LPRQRKLWSLDQRERRWMGRDHQTSSQAGRFTIAKLSETEGKTEETLTAKDIQLLSMRYQERLQKYRGVKAEKKLEDQPDSVQFLFDKYLWDYIEPRRSRGTYVQYKAALSYFIEANGNFPVGAWNHMMDLAFENHLIKKGLSDATIRKHQVAVQTAFTWLWKKKLIESPIWLEKKEVTRRPPHTWHKEDIERFEKLVLGTSDSTSIRTWMLARYAIMRNSEIWSLPLYPLSGRHGGIDLQKRIIQIRDNPGLDFVCKKKQARDVPLGEKLYEFIYRDLKNRRDKEVWWIDDGLGMLSKTSPSGLSRLFKGYRDQLGLTGNPLHTLRKTGITEALARNGRLEKVSKWAGHSGTNVTLEYYVNWQDVELLDTVNLIE